MGVFKLGGNTDRTKGVEDDSTRDGSLADAASSTFSGPTHSESAANEMRGFVPLTDANPKGDNGPNNQNVRTASDSSDLTVTDNSTGPSAPNLNQQAKDAGVLGSNGTLRDPSARELGIDVESVQRQDDVGRILAEDSMANRGVKSNSEIDEVLYSCHPMQNFQIGPYIFQDTLLRLRADKEQDFLDVIDQLPPADRLSIKKINLDRVDEIVAARESRVSQGITDSASGKAALEALKGTSPVIGTSPVDGRMGFDTGATHEGNEPTPATKAFDPQGETGMDQGPHTPDSAEQ